MAHDETTEILMKIEVLTIRLSQRALSAEQREWYQRILDTATTGLLLEQRHIRAHNNAYRDA